MLSSAQPGGDLAFARGAFVAEARINGLLEHPNILPVHDLGQREDGELYLAMKLVAGQTWQQRLRESPHDLEQHLGILLQVCNAIAYAHSRNIVHNDLKPANVMLGEFGAVLVVDWGLAVDIGEQPRGLPHRSGVTSPCGTSCYMPPELADGRGSDIDARTDVFLLGGLLYRILSGRAPRSGGHFLQVAVQARPRRCERRQTTATRLHSPSSSLL